MVAAFQAYLKLGESRSIGKVATELKMSKNTLMNWSKRYSWKARVIAWQEEEAEKSLQKMKDEFFKDSENLRGFKYKILNNLKERFEKTKYCGACEQGKLSVSELRTVWEIIKTELGEPTNITKNTAPDPGNDPFAIMLSHLFPPTSSVSIKPNADAKPN